MYVYLIRMYTYVNDFSPSANGSLDAVYQESMKCKSKWSSFKKLGA